MKELPILQFLLANVDVNLVSLYLVFINLASVALFWDDKRRALAHHYRHPETRLLFFALIGGSIGSVLAQQYFRHKTRKQPFASLLWAICICHAAICLLVVSGWP